MFDDTYGKDLPKIENYASVEATLVKGPWEVAKLEDQGRRNYLSPEVPIRSYWDSIDQKSILLPEDGFQGQKIN